MARSETEREAQRRYLRKVIRRYTVYLNVNTDGDIIEMLEQNGIAPYIKKLIRDDIAKKAKAKDTLEE